MKKLKTRTPCDCKTKVILEFVLPDDKELFYDSYHGSEYRFTLEELSNELRNKIKYETLPDGEVEIYEKVRTMLYDIVRERNLEII